MKLTANRASGPYALYERGRGYEAKLLRVMKLTTILMLAFCLHTSAKGVAQQTITFSGKEVSLENVFNAIKKQTSYRFFFNTDAIQHAGKVTIEVKNANIEQVMTLALKDQPLTFAIKGRTIFIMKKPEEEKSSLNVDMSGDPVTVSGKVTDAEGQPLAGANVKVKGSNTGVTTDNQGHFTLNNVDPNATLEISFVGHETQILSVKGKNFFTVALGQKVGTLDETVVIAYGTTTRRFSTGNVASVKASDIEKQPVSNPLLALQGRVPGLFITQNSGVPGGGITVRIQGQNSITRGNDPLYVIDGVPFFSQLPSTGLDAILGSSGGTNSVVGTNSNGNPLSYINPSDIESIEVLKDADATAIYGSRAANGAILITTKKGKPGNMKLDINLQTGCGQVEQKWDMLNTRQYLDMRYEALRNDGIDLATVTNTNSKYYDLKVWDTTRYTDWQKTIIGGTAQYTNLNTSVSGGTDNLRYLISGTYHKETTVFPGDFNDQKASVHFNINSSSTNQKFKTQFTGSYMVDNNHLLNTDLTQQAVLTEPIAPALYIEDGSINWATNVAGNSTWDNPLAETLSKYKNKTKSLVSNLTFNYEILPKLQLQTSLGYTDLQTDDYVGIPLIYNRPENRSTSQRIARYGNRNLNSWIFEPQISYNKKLGKGKLDVLVGGTIQQNNNEGGNITGRGYNSDEVMENKAAASQLTTNSQFILQYKYNAAFGRINYRWDDKYIINVTARRDGTSRFGSKNQFHNFGSIGAAWIFSMEKWMQNQKIISFGKLRTNYGTTGSDQIGDYAFMSLYNFWGTPGLPYQNTTGIYPAGIPNPYLQWEETTKLQVGIDLGLLSERILLSIAYGRNQSSNQLLKYALPSMAGYTSFNRNFPATVQNTNWEFSLNSINIKNKNLSWSSNINGTIPRNKVLSFPDYEKSTYASGIGGVIVGQPLGVTKTFHFIGVDPSTGLYQFADINGTPVSSASFPDDYVVLVSTMPKFYGGIQNNFKYKGIELDFLFQFVKQRGLTYNYHNSSRFPGQFGAGRSNQPVSVLDHWQKQGDISTIARYTSLTGYDIGDNFYADASYIRLKNLSLSYQFPSKWQQLVHLKNTKLYIQGQNLWTITNYKGLNPETQSVFSLPPLRIWTMGLQVGL